MICFIIFKILILNDVDLNDNLIYVDDVVLLLKF